MPVVLIPINCHDRELIRTMTGNTAPRWMRMAACLALEGRKVVLPRDGHPVYDTCGECGTEGLCTVRAFHKDATGGDARCVIACDTCGAIAEDRLLAGLEARKENPLKGIRGAF